MKSFKKALPAALVVALVLSILPGGPAVYAAEGTFSDIKGHWAQSAIEELAAKGIVSGMGDGTYQPNGPVTREQFMKLVVAVRGVSEGTSTDTFYDVPESAWANPYIAEGLSRGLFSLSETNGHYFEPGSPMDRDTVALWITRAAGLGGASDSTSFADNGSIDNKGAVATAVAEGLITGYEDNTFRPRNTLTRAESAVLIQRLIAKDAELNAPKEEHSEIVLQEGVLKFEPPAGVNVLVSADRETGLYVFENIDDNIRNLQPGEIFAIYPCTSVPEGIALKVKEIKISGDTAEIRNAGVELSDVVEKLDSSGTVPITLDMLEVAALPEGMTVTNARGQTVAEAKAEKKEGIYLADSNSLFNPESGIRIKFDGLQFSVDSPFRFSGELRLNLKFSHDIDYDFWRDGVSPRKIEVYMETNKTADIKVMCEAKDKNGTSAAFHDDGGNRGNIFGDTTSWDWAKSITSGSSKAQHEAFEQKVANISAPIGATGLCIYGAAFVGVSASGEIFLEVRYDETQKSGFRYQSGNVSSIDETKKTHSAMLGMEGRIEIGPKIEIGVTFLHIVKTAVNAAGGLGIKGSLDVISAEWNAVAGSTGLNNIASNEKRDGNGNLTELHDCWLCIDGDIYLYLEVGAAVGLTNIPFVDEFDFINETWKILDENNAKFLDFYVSVRPPALSASADLPQVQLGALAFGLTECPYIYKAPTITKQPKGQTVAAGKDVTITIEAKNESTQNLQEHNTKSGISYDWYHDGVKVEGGEGDDKLTIASVNPDDSGKYHCVVYLTGHETVRRTSDTIVLTVTAPDPPQVDTEFSDKSVETTAEDSKDGDFGDGNDTTDFSDKPVETTTGDSKGGDFEIIEPEFKK